MQFKFYFDLIIYYGETVRQHSLFHTNTILEQFFWENVRVARSDRHNYNAQHVLEKSTCFVQMWRPCFFDWNWNISKNFEDRYITSRSGGCKLSNGTQITVSGKIFWKLAHILHILRICPLVEKSSDRLISVDRNYGRVILKIVSNNSNILNFWCSLKGNL